MTLYTIIYNCRAMDGLRAKVYYIPTNFLHDEKLSFITVDNIMLHNIA